MHQHDLRLLQCRIRSACSHGHSDIRHRETGGVVHAIANHGHPLPGRCESANGLNLLLGLEFGAHLVHGQLRPKVFAGGFVIPGEDDASESELAELLHHDSRLWPDVVTQ